MSSGHLEGMSPELRQRMRDRLAIPEIKQAMTFWVMQCVEKLGQTKSKKHILGFLLHRLAPHGCTMPEVEYIYSVALETYEKQRRHAIEISLSGNPRIIQN